MKRTLILIVLVAFVLALIFAGWSWCGQHPEHAASGSAIIAGAVS